MVCVGGGGGCVNEVFRKKVFKEIIIYICTKHIHM